MDQTREDVASTTSPEPVYTVRDLAESVVVPRKERPDYEFSYEDYIRGVLRVFDSFRLLP